MNWEPDLIWLLNSDKTRTLNNVFFMKRRKYHSTKALQPLHWAEIDLVNQNPASATTKSDFCRTSFVVAGLDMR